MQPVSASWSSGTEEGLEDGPESRRQVGTLYAGDDLPATPPQTLMANFFLVFWESLLTLHTGEIFIQSLLSTPTDWLFLPIHPENGAAQGSPSENSPEL